MRVLYPRGNQNSGFSVVELLIVMVIISIILGIAIPSLNRSTTGTRLKTTADSITGLLETAKSFAQAQRTSCALVLDAANGKITLEKKDINDADNDGDRDEFIEFDRGIDIPTGITVYLTADNTVTFNLKGGLENPDDNITVTAPSISKQRTITVNSVTGYVEVS
jgi:prepilin-type N-terminal cleavage/methylation domain-containing protein